MSNLPSLVSIEFGAWCFGGYSYGERRIYGGASSFSLIDLPQLQSVKLGDEAFRYTNSFAMSNLPSLVSIEFGQRCFGGYIKYGDMYGGASSFSLIDLPQLQSVKLGNEAFRRTRPFAMSNLTSLVSIEFGQWCFGGSDIYGGGASSFSLIG
ncbi:hypothetical protein WA588_002087, partial [Blastocystis sp. NMH]